MQPIRSTRKISDTVGKEAESAVAPRKVKQSSADRPVSLKILADYL